YASFAMALASSGASTGSFCFEQDATRSSAGNRSARGRSRMVTPFKRDGTTEWGWSSSIGAMGAGMLAPAHTGVNREGLDSRAPHDYNADRSRTSHSHERNHHGEKESIQSEGKRGRETACEVEEQVGVRERPV